jgi:2-methylisocitrate lyase-like PEP mutase family enzyme
MKITTKLKHLIGGGHTLIAPGVFDGLSARMVERAGFEAIYASGGAIARSIGYPDLGLLSMTEVCQRLAHITETTQLPVIADADTGYGNALNVRRTVRQFERLGVAALHLEDQQFPKRCGHLEGKSIISKSEMVQKIRAARDALHDPDFIVIGRTDAIAIEGIDQAINRAQSYAEAGADVVFVEAPQSLEQIEHIAQSIKHPKLINMFFGGKTPLVPVSRLKELGYNIVIIPSDLQRAVIYAIEQTLTAIKQHGDSATIKERLATFNDRETVVDTDAYMELDAKFSHDGR